jgi:DNA polymerase
MTRKVSIDFETRSRQILGKKGSVGAYKYAECPSTKVLILAIKEGGLHDPGEYLTWDIRQPMEGNPALELLRDAIDFDYEIHAFNSQFEWAILKHVCPRQFGFSVPAIEQMRCTAAVCRSAGLPRNLGDVAAFLKLPVQKDKMGKALIDKFSAPQKKTNRFIEWNDDVSFTAGGERMTAGEAFQRFVDYCVTDVKTEVMVADVMKPFALQGFPLEWFLLDARLNDRGVPVDRQALQNAFDLYRSHERHINDEFRKLTGLGPKQNAKVLEWLKARGYRGSNLTKATREAIGNDDSMTDEAKRALNLAAELSFAAVKKIPAMLSRVMADDRIRGSFMWCGAQKTWRWTSEGVQWQNCKKPSKKLRKVIEQAFQDVRNGIDLELLESIYGNPYELIASLARYFVRFEDMNIYDLDYSSVEAKILPKLIECQRILDRFDSGEDIYTTTGLSLNKLLKEKFKVDFDIDRDMGKTVVLATQFQGGWNAVYTATGEKWNRQWCEAAVKVVREENPEFPKAWRKFQDTFVEAMDRPERWHPVTPYVSFGYTMKGPFPRMLMRLASGRSICWPLPEKEPITMAKIATLDKKTGKEKSTRWERVNGHFDSNEDVARHLGIGDAFLNPNTALKSTFRTWEITFYGHVDNGRYGRVKTYGGDALQSATQGTGADLLAYGAIEAEKRGFEPFFLVHDQCLNPAKGDREAFRQAMCVVPNWFKGFPLSADADEVRSYCKN